MLHSADVLHDFVVQGQGHIVSAKGKKTARGGLMVDDLCMDLLNSFGESKFVAKRCVQCGEVVDPVILSNRQLRQEPMTVQLAGRMLPNNCVMEGR